MNFEVVSSTYVQTNMNINIVYIWSTLKKDNSELLYVCIHTYVYRNECAMNFHGTVKRTNRRIVCFFQTVQGVMYVCKYITQGHDVPYAISLCILYPKIICLSYFFCSSDLNTSDLDIVRYV